MDVVTAGTWYSSSVCDWTLLCISSHLYTLHHIILFTLSSATDAIHCTVVNGPPRPPGHVPSLALYLDTAPSLLAIPLVLLQS